MPHASDVGWSPPSTGDTGQLGIDDMLYIALTFWLLVIVLTAWGVERLWGDLVKAKVINMVLLPGTLVAQVGHVLGLLVTGATINNVTLIGNDESAAPETSHDPQPRLPVVGPVIIGLLPLTACAVSIYFVTRHLGGAVMGKMSVSVIGPTLPTTMSGIWQLLRDQVSLVESLFNALCAANLADWKTGLFVYLVVCLAVRIAPFPGTLRGSLVAILVLGVVAAAVTSLFDVADPRVRTGWSVLNFTTATLLLLLLISLVIRGGVGLARILRGTD